MMTTYASKLKDPRWQRKRLEIMQRDGWQCTVLKRKTQTLHVHHRMYCGNPWDVPDDMLETVCEEVHTLIEELIHNLPGPIPFKAVDLYQSGKAAAKHIRDHAIAQGIDPDQFIHNDPSAAWKFSLGVWIELCRRGYKDALTKAAQP